MDNRYLYRAKRTDNGEWVEGYYMPRPNLPGEEKHYIVATGSAKWYEVDQSTICRCTGQPDKNGKLIFEGDIVKFEDFSAYPIVYDLDYMCLGSCLYSDFDPMYKYKKLKLEVIGNKFDNPELMEVE